MGDWNPVPAMLSLSESHWRGMPVVGCRHRYLGQSNQCTAPATRALPTEVVMIERYNRLPPEEQRIVVVTLVAAAAALWLAVAWEEVMVLSALPLLAGVAWGLIRTARRRAERNEELTY